jgi:hypothetical protein
MKWLLCVCLAGILVMTSVGAEDKLAETPYFPLQVGTTWIYKSGDNKLTQKVTKHEKVGDVFCARIETMYDAKPGAGGAPPATVAVEHVAVMADGVYRHDFTLDGKEAKSVPPICFLKLPPNKDDTWVVDSKVLDKAIKCNFKSGEAEVKVPASTYQTVTATCTDLDVNGLKATVTYYFAKDVGMVKQVIESPGDKKSITTIELEKFEAPKK